MLQFQASVLEFVPLYCFGFVAAGGEIGFNPIRLTVFQIQVVMFTHRQLDSESSLDPVWMGAH